MDLPRIRWNLQSPRYQEIALRELSILFTHILVPCPECTCNILREREVYTEYVSVFIPELLSLTANILHKQTRQFCEGKEAVLLPLAINGLLVLLRFFIIPSSQTLLLLLQDFFLLLAVYPPLPEEVSEMDLSDCSGWDSTAIHEVFQSFTANQEESSEMVEQEKEVCAKDQVSETALDSLPKDSMSVRTPVTLDPVSLSVSR